MPRLSPSDQTPLRRGILSPVIVVAWLWTGLLALLLLYLRSALWTPLPNAGTWLQELRSLWWTPTPLGLPLRHLIKLVNLMLVALIWLKWRSMRRWRQRPAFTDRLLYLGTAVLLLALEWACHIVGESLARAET